jgi:hypothetical protein
MLVSAEIRWFWRRDPPPGLHDWFCGTRHHPCRARGGQERVDRYLRDPDQTELGLKLRGGGKGVQVKGLIDVVSDGVAAAPFTGPVEIWCKWTSDGLRLRPSTTIAVEKQRRMRKFDATVHPPKEVPLGANEKPANGRPLPDLGCNVELTQVKPPNGEVWWTFCFEAFGTPETVVNDLRATAEALASRTPPPLDGGLIASYPTWLAHLLRGDT